ncbi:MAG: M20/M25/M40 family metallo-hydrolase [Sutterellaceae bacterium]|nr:M20/M25/M40 family metallo-hydrolase [Sutterellaceae bacterium]
MTNAIPELDAHVFAAVESLKSNPKVARGLAIALEESEMAMKEQCEICEIPAPTFEESVRAEDIVRRMKLYGLTDVAIDEIGNVVGRRPGKGNGPSLALGAHMDTVFPAGTDVKVRQEGNRYSAPGIGDNCSGQRALLQVLRCFNEAGIETEGDLWFVGTVGEEGNGDTRGSKFFNAHHKVDGFIAIDNTDVGRILRGAVGSHRWRVSIDGPAGHSFAAFGKVPSAIHAMCLAGARIAHIEVPESPKTTFTIGTIKGGTTVNTIAAHCEVDVDMRSLDNEELLKLETKVLNCFDEAAQEENAIWNITDEAKKLKVTKTQIGDRPAGIRPDNCPVLQASRAAQKLLGIELTNYGYSSTDANFPVSQGVPATCLSAGGVQVGSHTLKEYFDCIDIHLGPQLIFLAAAALVGAEGSAPILPKRD